MNTPHDVMMRTLRFALSLRRPYGSASEGRLVAHLSQLAVRLAPKADVWVDAAGNLHVDTRPLYRNDTTRRTLFVAHTDTVHRSGGLNVFDSSTPMWKAQGNVPLGADDGAGVALMCGLIAGGVKAYFIFTRGEESCGVGARYLADDCYELLSEFDRAIAVDRRDVISVITHQARGRCCSTAFAEALCDQLNERDMLMMPDDTGVYTDTAEFMEIIPECTNISAGYYNEHSTRESLDTEYLGYLLKAMLTVKWDDLPVERDPADGDAEDYGDMTGQWGAAYDRWRAEELAVVIEDFDPITGEPVVDVASDPFAWSDDGKTINTGSGRRRH